MLRIYKPDTAGQLHSLSEMDRNSWVCLTEPTEEEICRIKSQLGIPVDFIHDSLDANERSRVQTIADHLLLIIHVPLTTAKKDVSPYRTVPIGLIMNSEVIVTVCRVDHPILRECSEQVAKHFSTNWKYSFAMQLLRKTARYYLSCLDDLDRQIAAAEKTLQKSIHNKEVYKLLHFNKSLVYFVKSLKVNRSAIQKFNRVANFERDIEEVKLFEDVHIEMQQALDTAEIHNTNLSNLMDAYSAVIENNLNVALKLLTAFTVISAIPMAIASIYGMNTPLPIQDEGYALTLLMSIGVGISLMTGWIFYKLRLF